MTELLLENGMADYDIGPPPKSGRGRAMEPLRPQSAERDQEHGNTINY